VTFLLSVAALTSVYLVVGIAERRPALRFRLLPSPRPYLATDTAWYALAIIATAISVFAFQPLLSQLAIGPVADRVASLPVATKLLVAVVTFDFLSFLVHRQLHRSDRLWEFHKVHHSTLHLDGFATTRTHMFENLNRFVPPQAVLFAIGMPVEIVAPTVAIAAIYGVSNHSNLDLRLRPIEALLVTPRLHRRHHVPTTTQNNFGAIFTIWDRLFGTLARVDTAPHDRYGVPGEIDAYPQQFLAAFRRPIATRRSATDAGDHPDEARAA
jgi:sterol desaturase/sphingolipid hydroxylase (fatty acid hydroxylase superfamily)